MQSVPFGWECNQVDDDLNLNSGDLTISFCRRWRTEAVVVVVVVVVVEKPCSPLQLKLKLK